MSRAAGILLAAMLAAAGSFRAETPSATGDPWRPLRPLAGTWKGEGSGSGGLADVTHEWEFVTAGKFLRLRTRSTPRAPGKSGDIHEDVGYLSRDTDEGIFVFRQFLSEGFVNTFEVGLEEGEQLALRFDHRESESAGGMKARMRLQFLSGDEYEMLLELAAPGKEFAPCQRVRMRRS